MFFQPTSGRVQQKYWVLSLKLTPFKIYTGPSNGNQNDMKKFVTEATKEKPEEKKKQRKQETQWRKKEKRSRTRSDSSTHKPNSNP